MRGADLGLTDHYLVRAKLRVKLKKHTSSSAAKILDSQRLGCEQVRAEFKEEVERRVLQTGTADGVEYSWKSFKDALCDSAVNVLGYRRTRRLD